MNGSLKSGVATTDEPVSVTGGSVAEVGVVGVLVMPGRSHSKCNSRFIMNPTFDVFWNAKPDVASELAFLDQLRADLKRAKVSATILANYFTNSRSRQVDFLVVTERHVCHVELKNYVGELHGEKNGPWSIVKDDG